MTTTTTTRGRGRPPKMTGGLLALVNAARGVGKLAEKLAVDRGTVSRWAQHIASHGKIGQEPSQEHRDRMAETAQELGLHKWRDPWAPKKGSK